MTRGLKITILASSALAVLLNAGQLFASYRQRQAAFAPSWAYADTTAPVVPASTPATTVATTPDQAAAVQAKLSAAGLKPSYAALYLSVQDRTGTPWQLLAAVHRAETGQSGTTTRTSYAGATGPMQFMPATFRAYASDGNGDGRTDIHNLDDAMLSAGRYLAASGAARGQYSTALYRYNHSWSYVSSVSATAKRLGLL